MSDGGGGVESCSFKTLRDFVDFLSVCPVGSFDGAPHRTHLLGVDDAAKRSKRSPAKKPFDGVADRLIVALVSLDSFA